MTTVRSTTEPSLPVGACAVEAVGMKLGAGGPGDASRGRATTLGVLVGAAALAAAGPPLRRRLARHVGAPIAELVATSALTAAGWAMVAAVERLRPYRPEWGVSEGDVELDLTFALVAAPPAALVATLVADRCRSGEGTRAAIAGHWPGGLPLPVRVALATGVTELVHYWHHRLSHEQPLLWRFHSVHHSSTRLYWLNSGRFHPVDLAPLLTLQLVAVRLLGVDEDAFTAMQIFKGIHGQIQHSNMVADAGPLNAVFSTAEQHRWHHAADGAAGACNYGAVLSIFDRAFSTKVLPKDREVGAVGLARGGARPPAGFTEQLLAPLRRRRAPVCR
ncbi:MAG: conserved rane protein of unknown function [Acidimicrobiales bacterium]|nr:conserved rane protein of unknown function [Acidimicrobiales bacterium]